MKIGIIIETNEPEKAWNGVRFGNTALKNGNDVKLFLMSAGVEIGSIVHDKFNPAKRDGPNPAARDQAIVFC